MPEAANKGKCRVGARQGSPPASPADHFSTEHMHPDVFRVPSYIFRVSTGATPSSAIGKKSGKAKSPITGWDSRMGVKTRAATARGTAKSPGGTKHEYYANSGITPDGCDEVGKAVLRGAQKHPGVPGCSKISPAQVSDSPIRMGL